VLNDTKTLRKAVATLPAQLTTAGYHRVPNGDPSALYQARKHLPLDVFDRLCAQLG
jgi:hypothetical protein